MNAVTLATTDTQDTVVADVEKLFSIESVAVYDTFTWKVRNAFSMHSIHIIFFGNFATDTDFHDTANKTSTS